MSSRPTRVVFDLERDTYHTTEDVVCSYEILETLEADSWDYIGIFPVGWQSQNAYKTYEYVSLPEGYEKGKKAKCVTKFLCRNLPKDEDYYQFCYISRKHKICGASGPFQFRSSLASEFVEEESEGMMLIRPKVEVMEEEIRNLGHKVMMLSTERDSLQQTVENSQKIMEVRDQLITKLQAEVRTLGEMDEEEKERNQQLSKQVEDLKTKLKALQEAKKEAEETLCKEKGTIAELQRQIKELQSNIRAMQIEKDELSGQNQSLVTELDTYKLQVADSQTMVTQSQKTINKMNESLEESMNQCTAVVEECELLKERNSVNEERLGHLDGMLTKVLQEKKMAELKASDLAFELQNANDKLQACDTMKMKLSSDLDAYEITQAKMNTKFENQESEMRSMKEKLEKKTKECVELQKSVTAKTAELNDKSEKLCRSEANLHHTLMTIQKQNELQKSSASKYAEVENHVTETQKQLALVSTQLKTVTDEKLALQLQLQGFEEELRQSLLLKEKEMAEMASVMKEKEQLMRETDEELVATAHGLKVANDLSHKLEKNIESINEDLKTAAKTMEYLRKREEDLLAQVSSLEEERDDGLERCSEMEKALDELKNKYQQEEDATFCLRTAHEALVSRIEDKDRELSKLNQEVKELKAALEAQRCVNEEGKKELMDLRQRLELGKLEYTKEATENWKLTRLLKKEVNQVERRAAESGSVSSNSDNSDEEAAEKYRQLYKHMKKQKHELQAAFKEKQKMLQTATDECREYVEEIEELNQALRESRELVLCRDIEIEHLTKRLYKLEKQKAEAEEKATNAEEEARSTELIYGNPYAAKVEAGAESPKQQAIIRSTLEEEDDSLLAAAGEGHQLPPPLEPEVVSTHAAAASCNSLLEEVSAEEGAHDIFEDCTAVPPVDERFMDAIGEGMKICPFCETSVMASSDFEEHVATHFGRICPVCRSQADDSMTFEVFEQHVNKCLDKESAAESTEDLD